MKILSIQPKDIYVTMELGLFELSHLIAFLDNSVMDYDGGKQPELEQAANWINTFYKTVKEVYNDVQGDKYGS